MKQDLIINRLYSVVCHLSSVNCPLHLSRILYKSALFMQNKPNLRRSQMNVRSYNTKDYENKSSWTLGENKPKQSQNKPNSNPISEMPKMNVNISITKDYENKTAFRRIKNKPNQSQFQTQFQHLLHPQRVRVKYNYLHVALFPFTSSGPRCYNDSVHNIHTVRNIQ